MTLNEEKASEAIIEKIIEFTKYVNGNYSRESNKMAQVVKDMSEGGSE